MSALKMLMPVAVSVAAVAGLGAAPVSAATATSISATTAGTKAVGQTTFVWGNVSGVPKGTQVCDQVLLPTGAWSRSQCSTTQTDAGYYAIPLTYGASTPGTYSYRVVSSGAVSQAVSLTRLGVSTSVKSNINERVYAKAKSKEGSPYVWGAQGPHSFDCSGLVRWAYTSSVGKPLVQGSFNQVNAPQVHVKHRHIPIRDVSKYASAHDLVFFYDKQTKSIGHVGWHTSNTTFYSATFYGGMKATTTTYANYAQYYDYVTIADWKAVS